MFQVKENFLAHKINGFPGKIDKKSKHVHKSIAVVGIEPGP